LKWTKFGIKKRSGKVKARVIIKNSALASSIFFIKIYTQKLLMQFALTNFFPAKSDLALKKNCSETNRIGEEKFVSANCIRGFVYKFK